MRKYLRFASIATVLLLLTSINACSSGIQNQTGSSVSAVSSSKPGKIDKKIVGRWEANDRGKTTVMLFTSDRKMIMWESGDTEAMEFGEYTIDSSASPMVLNISANGKTAPFSIVELISKKQMRFQLPEFSMFQDPTPPTSFDESAIVFEKASNSGKLPSNIRLRSSN